MKKISAISSIIPSYNGCHLLKKHLPSVFDAVKSGDQVVIVDDASTDDTLEWLISKFSLHVIKNQKFTFSGTLYKGTLKHKNTEIELIVLANKMNVRFAQSVNRAVETISNDYFFLVNNDVSVEPDAITILREQISQDDSIFAVGCLEYENSKSGEKSGKNLLWFERGLFQHSKARDFESGETAWASGGSAIFSRKKWLALGGFDTSYYPAYWEDTDISYRARKKGWQVVFNKNAVVFHQHESTNASVFGSKSLENISWKNAFNFTWRNGNFFQKVQLLLWAPYWHLKRIAH
ncbi:MAG: hypothetical protein QG639_1095 [Patescibacteria group bacterium]|jgi:GT2 family glycosyltransferase|nr:hypothetical protein [Patescibacteria group bacterium]